MRFGLLFAIAIAIISSFTFTAPAEDWPQFRGPGGRAISETATPPAGFGQASNVVWKVAVPKGDSSPIVTGQRIFLTAATDGVLETLCLDRKDGRVLWRKQTPANPPGPDILAIPTPVTDGESVYVFFGAFGLIAYDLDGHEQWRQPLVTPDAEDSASPILIDNKLIIVCDKGAGSFIEARDKKDGHTLWRVERPQFRRSRATPFHWVHGKGEELIVSGSFWLTSYDPRSGKENWHYTGTARYAISSPTAGENLLFSASSDIGVNEAEDKEEPIPDLGDFTKVLPPRGEKGLLAVSPGGSGDIGTNYLAWKSARSLPYASSPLFYKGRLFTVKDGGFISAYDVKSGHPIYQDERLNAPGNYWASAVAAADRIYFASYYGTVTVINATADTPTILAENKLGEEILATPALIDQTIIFRTTTNLYSFGGTR